MRVLDMFSAGGRYAELIAYVVGENAHLTAHTNEASSYLLNNPDDDLTEAVFAAGIRGKTDRFAMRFRNPA